MKVQNAESLVAVKSYSLATEVLKKQISTYLNNLIINKKSIEPYKIYVHF